MPNHAKSVTSMNFQAVNATNAPVYRKTCSACSMLSGSANRTIQKTSLSFSLSAKVFLPHSLFHQLPQFAARANEIARQYKQLHRLIASAASQLVDLSIVNLPSASGCFDVLSSLFAAIGVSWMVKQVTIIAFIKHKLQRPRVSRDQ